MYYEVEQRSKLVKCVTCQEVRDLGNFQTVNSEEGFCITCRAKAAKKMLASAKARANKLNLEFNLELYDCFVPGLCPILKIPLYKGGPRDNCPSLDRIDNSKGYIKGNVHVISMRANRIKSDSSLEELIKIVAKR